MANMEGLNSPAKSTEISGTQYLGTEVGQSMADMEKGKATSPLNELLPNISTKNIKPLVNSFCDKVATLDLSLRESRVILGQMFLEIIQAVSKMILDAFRDMVLEGKKGRGPLLLSEEAVHRAVHPSLCESFKAALGSTHQSMNKLFTLVCHEVTTLVNRSLCCSRVKDDRLVVVEDSNYKPSKDRMRAILDQGKNMLCALMVCGIKSTNLETTDAPSKTPSTAKEQDSDVTKIYNQESHITPFEDIQDKVEGDVDKAEEIPPKRVCPRIEDICRCFRGGSDSERREEEGLLDKQKEGHICNKLESFKAILCYLSCGPCRKWAPSEEDEDTSGTTPKSSTPKEDLETPIDRLTADKELIPIQPLSADQDLTKPVSPNLKEATDVVKNILEQEATQLTGEAASYGSEETASTIVTIIVDEMEEKRSECSETQMNAQQKGTDESKMPCLKGVAQKIKSYFAWCYASAALSSLLCKLCCKGATVSSPEEVMKRSSPLLKDMTSGGMSDVADEDIYKKLSQGISRGEYDQLTEQISDAISENISPQKEPTTVKGKVQEEVKGFMGNFRKWLHIQQHTDQQKDPVQRAMSKIRNVSIKMFSYISKAQEESTTITGLVPTTAGQQSYQWDKTHFFGLIFEVSRRIFTRTQESETYDLCRNVLQQMEPQKLKELNIKVEPKECYIDEVADAVYSDLWRGQKKTWVRASAIIEDDFSTKVIDTIIKNLESPPPRKCISVFPVCGGR